MLKQLFTMKKKMLFVFMIIFVIFSTLFSFLVKNNKKIDSVNILNYNLQNNKETVNADAISDSSEQNEVSNIKTLNCMSCHYSSAMQFKAKTRSALESMYLASNLISLDSSEKILKDKEKLKLRKTKKVLPNFSELEQFYKFYTYDEIVEELLSLARKYPRYLKVKTAQELYDVPVPGGDCGKDKNKCFHYVAFLTDYAFDIKSKPQVKLYKLY